MTAGSWPPVGPEELMRTVLPKTSGAFYSCTRPPERRLLEVSPGWDELVGGAFEAPGDLREEGADSRPALADLVHRDDRSRVDAEIRESLEESGSYSVVYRMASRTGGSSFRHPPGRSSRDWPRWAWDRGHRVGEGEALHLRGLLMDITELKSVEDRSVQGQRKEALGALSGSVAQEFNNLLTAIYGSLDLARVQTDDPRIVKEEIRAATQAVKRARTLTDQLVSFARARPQRPRRGNPSELVESMKPFIESVAGSSVRTIVTLDPHGPEIRFDQGLLEQAIMNLVLNAREAMEDGGGRLLVSTGDVVFDEEDVRPEDDIGPGRYATISIADTGSGVDPDIRPRIYEPFFTTKEGHSGLGLSAAFGIVRQSGGVVRIRSSPGSGTRATIYLPVADEARIAGSDAAASGADVETDEGRLSREKRDRGRGVRVLLVEDDEDVRNLLVRILTRYDFDVVAVGRAEEALRIAREESPSFDLLVTDVMLPGMNGPELVRTIAPLQPEARFLIMSGFAGDPELRSPGLPEGSVFLPKPFTVDEILDAVEDALDRPAPAGPPSSSRYDGSGGAEAG